MVGILAVMVGLVLVGVKMGVFVNSGVAVNGPSVNVGEINGVLVASTTGGATMGVSVGCPGGGAFWVS